MVKRSTDTEEHVAELKKRSFPTTIVVLSITTVIGILAWGWQFFVQPMIKTPTDRLTIVESAMANKVNVYEFNNQKDFTQAALDKKVDRETFMVAVKGIKDAITESKNDLKYDIREVKTAVSKHIENSPNK